MKTWRKALDLGYGCQGHLEVQKSWGGAARLVSISPWRCQSQNWHTYSIWQLGVPAEMSGEAEAGSLT